MVYDVKVLDDIVDKEEAEMKEKKENIEEDKKNKKETVTQEKNWKRKKRKIFMLKKIKRKIREQPMIKRKATIMNGNNVSFSKILKQLQVLIKEKNSPQYAHILSAK